MGFLINMVWEVWHSQLYTTCLKQEWTKNVQLLTIMSLKDAFFICLFYAISFEFIRQIVIFKFGDDFFAGSIPLAPHAVFFLIALAFSFVDEKIAIAKKRWEYAPSMPLFFGVGVTPLFEIAVTGLAAFYLVSL